MFGRRTSGRPSSFGRESSSRSGILFSSRHPSAVAFLLAIAASSALAEQPTLVADASSTASRDVASSTPTKSKSTLRGGKQVTDFGSPEVALINEAIRKGWADHDLAPSK